MAQLKDLLVEGQSRMVGYLYASSDIYEKGTALEDKYGATLSISGTSLSLKSKNGGSLSSVTLPDNNTTYTFANGTNGFTVTPSGGSAQTVTVTPSITNNVTGTGTSGYLAKFNGTNTITNGPQLGTSTTTFLNNKGEWATPVGTTYSAGDGMTLSTTTFKVNAGTGLTFDTSSPKKLTIAAATTTALGGVKVPVSGGLSLSSGSLSINVGNGLKIDTDADNGLAVDLTASDIPSLTSAKISDFTNAAKTAVGIASSGTTYLQKNGSWSTPANTTYTFASGASGFTVTPSGGSAQTVTTNTSFLVTAGDNRSVSTKPNDYSNKLIFQGLKNNSAIGSPYTTTYSYLVGLRGWAQQSGGYAHELAFGGEGGISMRSGASTSWGNWEKIASQSWVEGKGYSPYVEQSKTFTGLIGSANSFADAGFFVGKIIPTDYGTPWSIKYRIYINAAGQADSVASAEVFYQGVRSALTSYYCYNSIANTSYRPAYYHCIYTATSTGVSTYGHIIGVDLVSSWNRTTAANARTATFEILDTQNCTFAFFDSATKYASVPGTGTTNYSALTEPNFYASGLQETGDANDLAYYIRYSNFRKPASDTARYYKIYFTSADGTQWVPASVNSTNDATTARAVNQRPIDPFGTIAWYNTTTNLTQGTVFGAPNMYTQYPLTLGYSFNRTGAALTLTVNKPVYIKCAPQSNGSAIMDATTPYVQDLPMSADNKIYILLGVAYSATAIELIPYHPVYCYQNGGIRLWTGQSLTYYEGDAIDITSNTISVKISSGLALTEENELVPNFGTQANTVAQGNHSHTITAAVTDGVWDLTGTNGTNKVTYAVAPYPAATATSSWITTSANAGKFYLGTNRVPYATTRLNYNGYFYARDVYANGFSVDSRLTALEEQICLIEGSKIKMADGSEKNIEDVKTGDMILSYDPANGKQIEAMALQSVRTGVAKDYDVLIFENGNYAELFKEHSIYNVELGYPCSHKEWKVGDIGLMVDGNQSALARITTSRHAIVKQRYVLCTTTGLYFANGILMGIWPSTKYNIVTRPCYNLELPDDILSKFKTWGEANDRSNLLEVNPEFISRSKTIQSTIHRLTKEIEDCKKNLLDTDYIVTKFTEGLISATEWAKSKIKRANWRTMINDDEGPLETAKQQLENLKAEIKGNNPSLKEIYWGSVTEAISMLPDFQQWLAERNKTEELEVTIE